MYRLFWLGLFQLLDATLLLPVIVHVLFTYFPFLCVAFTFHLHFHILHHYDSLRFLGRAFLRGPISTPSTRMASTRATPR